MASVDVLDRIIPDYNDQNDYKVREEGEEEEEQEQDDC
jgi:hypothetical protein